MNSCCSMNKQDHLHARNVHFHNVGLSNTNSSIRVKGKVWPMGTMEAHRTALGHLEVSHNGYYLTLPPLQTALL